jgi:predicted outer membrane protein
VRNLLVLALLSGLLVSCGERQAENDSIAVIGESNAAAGQPVGPAPAETRGQDFVSTVLGSYDFVLASARAAGERSQRPEVKEYAAKVAADLGASLDQLKGVAGASRLTLEPTPLATGASDLAILTSTRGTPFDKAFAESQMEALTGLVGLIRAYKNGGDNDALKAWAATHQAIVNDRLLDVQTLKAVVEEAEIQAGN